MKSFRRELQSLFSVGIVTVGVVLSFPLSSISFKATPVPGDCQASAAFVKLSQDEESMALKAAKTAWQSDASAMQRMRVRLPLGELPAESEERSFNVVPLEVRKAAAPDPLEYGTPPYRPSMSAPPPRRLAVEPERKAKPAFSREDMLDLN